MKLAILFVSLLLVTTASAKVYTIAFGGVLGNNYVPLALPNVGSGDTIRWVGDFSFHPLTSDALPAGATAFSNTSGTTFEYVPTVAGIYGYHCEVHGGPGSGMFGGFQVVDASVKQTKIAGVELFQNYPNPVSGTTTLSFELAKPSLVKLNVYTADGREVLEAVNGQLASGTHEVIFDATKLTAGIYMYRLQLNGEAITRQLIVTK